MTWGKFAIDPEGEVIAGGVSITFVTEKRLFTQEASPENIFHASIRLSVTSSDADWSERTFDEIVPHIDGMKLGGIYTPLWIFRKPYFINVVSLVLGWVGFFTGTHFPSLMLSKSAKTSTAELLKRILGHHTMPARKLMSCRNIG